MSALCGCVQGRLVWFNADGEGEPGEREGALLRTFFTYEPVSCNLSQNLSRKNAKP